jgi:hypothetical protein
VVFLKFRFGLARRDIVCRGNRLRTFRPASSSICSRGSSRFGFLSFGFRFQPEAYRRTGETTLVYAVVPLPVGAVACQQMHKRNEAAYPATYHSYVVAAAWCSYVAGGGLSRTSEKTLRDTYGHRHQARGPEPPNQPRAREAWPG